MFLLLKDAFLGPLKVYSSSIQWLHYKSNDQLITRPLNRAADSMKARSVFFLNLCCGGINCIFLSLWYPLVAFSVPLPMHYVVFQLTHTYKGLEGSTTTTTMTPNQTTSVSTFSAINPEHECRTQNSLDLECILVSRVWYSDPLCILYHQKSKYWLIAGLSAKKI